MAYLLLALTGHIVVVRCAAISSTCSCVIGRPSARSALASDSHSRRQVENFISEEKV
jgi:hypothetical protein